MDILSYVLGYNKGKSQGGGTSADERVKYVTFMYGDTELIKYPVIVGDTCKCPVTAGLIEAPTKEPTESIVYSFGGWSLTNGGAVDSNALKNVTTNRTVYAAFTESVRTYTVNFYDGETLIKSEQVAYGGSSTYAAEKEGYFFSSWSPEPINVTADMDCYAQWVEVIDFASASWAEIERVSKDGNASKMWSVGDRKTITIGGVDKEIVIIGFDMDKDSDGNTVGITMTIADEPYPTGKFARNNWKNWGNATDGPQKAVDDVLITLPEDLQSVIKPVQKDYNLINSWNEFLPGKKATKSLWQFDVQELGMAERTDVTYTYTLPAYPYFNSDANRVLNYSGSAVNYGTRTIMKTANGYYSFVGSVSATGQVDLSPGDATQVHVRFGFCV